MMLPIATSTNTGASASWMVCAIMPVAAFIVPPGSLVHRAG